MAYSRETTAILERLRKNEITGYYVYSAIAKRIRDEKNAAVIRRIADEEMEHYKTFSGYLDSDREPGMGGIRLSVFIYVLLARVFGLTFTLKIFEKNEGSLDSYREAAKEIPEILSVIHDEEKHEKSLIAMIDEEKLAYIGAVVLGLNDALVELTGALAGFTLSVQNSRTIALLGLITGISAAFSMSASEYLSSKAENSEKLKPGKASIYTGIAYILTVIALVLPFLLLQSYVASLIITISIAILIIAFFNYYISVAMEEPFFKRFAEMALISIGVAAISFLIGFLVKKFLGLEI